jgi:hypothetical protein
LKPKSARCPPSSSKYWWNLNLAHHRGLNPCHRTSSIQNQEDWGYLQNAIYIGNAAFISTGLQPGVGWVWGTIAVSTTFSARWEAAEAAEMTWTSGVTGLKPGANEKTASSNDFENTP